jgi:aspartyl-tRNA(Asn)/glutamyl-tRNA(Gln) amidotransferase subunit A
MARMVRSGKITPAELFDAHRKQIREINPQLNAVVALLDEAAVENDGPLAGVPFSAKDSIDVQGVRTTAGTLERRNAATAEKDATVVRRLRAAGGLPIAKTNLPDLLFSFESDNLIFGRSSNPSAAYACQRHFAGLRASSRPAAACRERATFRQPAAGPRRYGRSVRWRGTWRT